ncbi:hypothetical protein AKJ09_08586 [Labilithrix luteola]|uniref:PilZ domain-containing protein n=1 Tax=Labilithrix luteola TaxID=1391654 RepID=A0A0K1Q855_9BACT|nr:PilZ domain-containing protein [Labilithrix luteola]AKV01923.1 hypothetical protein AKJ09_08586 [Labilithrix luteola]
MNAAMALPMPLGLAMAPSSRSFASRRVATRRDVVLECQAVRERDFKLIADRTLDVSTVGLLLPLRESVEIGESVIVSFQIPGMWIDAEATVARVIRGLRPSDDGPAVGLVFDAMSFSARAALAGFLHGRPPPLPRRGPLARMRRGLSAPILADQGVMETMSATAIAESPVLGADDVEDVVEGEEQVDVFGVLCEMASAWMRLASP